VILLEEQTSEFMYVVFSGKAKVIKISQEGREKILAIREKGDFFGKWPCSTARLHLRPWSPWSRRRRID